MTYRETGNPPSKRYQPDSAPAEPPVKDPLGGLKVIVLAPLVLTVAAVLVLYEELRDVFNSDSTDTQP